MDAALAREKTQKFWNACYDGCLATVRKLASRPYVDINWKNPRDDDNTGLHKACKENNVDIVAFLLSLPSLDVNATNNFGCTALIHAVNWEHVDISLLLLQDPRVAADLLDENNCTPLWVACHNGSSSIMELLLASQKPLRMEQKPKRCGGLYELCLPLEAIPFHCSSMKMLLKRYTKDPAPVVMELRRKWRWPTAPASIFALVIFVSDHFLQL